MSAQIAVEFQCGSCERTARCKLLEGHDDWRDVDEWYLADIPEGWAVEVGETPERHIVQCPDHRRLR